MHILSACLGQTVFLILIFLLRIWISPHNSLKIDVHDYFLKYIILSYVGVSHKMYVTYIKRFTVSIEANSSNELEEPSEELIQLVTVNTYLSTYISDT